MRYHELVGKQVVGADGMPVGRVADLVAERRGDALRITALRVGPPALVQRIAFRRTPSGTVREITWALVARVGERIQLRVNAADLGARGAAGGVEAQSQC